MSGVICGKRVAARVKGKVDKMVVRPAFDDDRAEDVKIQMFIDVVEDM